jgi:hypothetical protein
MRVKTDVVVKKLKQKTKQWDAAFDQFQANRYPMGLPAQAQYREQLKVLISTRLLVEERLLNFSKS